MLYAFAELHGVPCAKRGKLVVATSSDEDRKLEAIATRAAGNGVDDLHQLDAAEARRLEPALRCSSALLSPSTGVIDLGALLEALRVEAEEHGAVLAFQAPLLRAFVEHRVFTLEVGGAAPMRISCRELIVAAGHGAPALACEIEGLADEHVPKAWFAKGSYFRCNVAVPFTRLIYTLPVPGGVGTHLTIDPAGTARFGPDVEWVESLDYTVDPARSAGFAADIRRWWPALPEKSLRPDFAKIRPKIAGPGEPDRDFIIQGENDHGVAGLVTLFGIESPGVTACLAIAAHAGSLLPG